jgi:hypothetical protein
MPNRDPSSAPRRRRRTASKPDAAARAAGRARWRRWAALRRAGNATARFEYDGAVLARLRAYAGARWPGGRRTCGVILAATVASRARYNASGGGGK